MVGENLSKKKKSGAVGALGLQLNEGGEQEEDSQDESDLNFVSSGRDQNEEESKAIVNPTENVGNERESM